MTTKIEFVPESKMPKKMTPQEVDAYLKSVADGERKLDGMEKVVLDKLRAAERRADQLSQVIQNAQRQAEQARAEILSLQGEVRAFAGLLINAEEGRRLKQDEAPDGAKPALAVVPPPNGAAKEELPF